MDSLQGGGLLGRALGVLLLPAQFMKSLRANHVQTRLNTFLSHPSRPVRVVITVAPDLALDGLVCQQRSNEGRWLVFFCPNGALYEEVGEFMLASAVQQGRNLLLFNYRGCGSSEGSPSSGDDLVEDGLAALRYLCAEHGVSGSSDVILHGHSIGGAVAVCVSDAAELALGLKPSCVSDRSFSSLDRVVQEKLRTEPALGGLVGAALFLLIGLGGSLLAWPAGLLAPSIYPNRAYLRGMALLGIGLQTVTICGGWRRMLRQFGKREWLIVGLAGFSPLVLSASLWWLGWTHLATGVKLCILAEFAGAALGWRGMLAAFGAAVVRAGRWSLDARAGWRRIRAQGRGVVLYHPADEMIPLNTSLRCFDAALPEDVNAAVCASACRPSPGEDHVVELGSDGRWRGPAHMGFLMPCHVSKLASALLAQRRVNGEAAPSNRL